MISQIAEFEAVAQCEGVAMHALAHRLFPICRSITGEGTRATLAIIMEHLADLTVHEVPSGTHCFDWIVPDEWNIRDAYLVGPDGNRVVDFGDSNLHVVNYSLPINIELTLDQLQPHLHSLPDQPDAIPYVTSYYTPRWGFCLPHVRRESLRAGTYRAVIDATLAPGSLSYAELLIPGETTEEIFVSTYVCHPSLANNELSGPVVAVQLAQWVAAMPRRRFSYRFIFIPETIGAIAYLSRNLADLRRNVVAGFVATCLGDERAFSFMPSRGGATLADRAARHVLVHIAPGYKSYSFLERGSDERQYCAPGVDLPVASVMRSKYGEYPEYHTSLDNLDLVTPLGLAGGFLALRRCIEVIEADRVYRTTVLGEPQLGRRGLYDSLGGRSVSEASLIRGNLLAYCDGSNSLLDIAEILGQPAWSLVGFVEELVAHQLLEDVEERTE